MTVEHIAINSPALHRPDGVQTDSAIRLEYDVTFPSVPDTGDSPGSQGCDHRTQDGGTDCRGGG